VAVWIGDPIDRDYRVRCERTDFADAARCWLAAVASYDAVAAHFGCTSDRTGHAGEPGWLGAA
jgi:hypothetical protein